MPLSPSRLPFLYPALRLSRPTVTTIRRYRHGTAVEPIPTPTPAPDSTTSPNTNNTTTALKDDALSASTPSIQPTAPLSPLTSSSSSSTPITPPRPAGGAVPSLSPREWTHHFDTYSVAASLTRSGFRPSQSAIIMKSIRSLLATNLDLAHTTLVSKSNVENESYLFHAACAELRNEVVAERKAALDALRAETAALQAAYDELNQRFLEEIMALKEELNNMFNERKMANRAQMREMENRVQELNWKITVVIGAEVRSEVEGLRWTTTRRGLIAIGALAAFVVTSIRLSNEGSKRDRKKSSSSGSSSSGSERHGGDTHDFENRIVPTDMLAESLANPGLRSSSGASFVSLG